jgi:hypothetical protein
MFNSQNTINTFHLIMKHKLSARQFCKTKIILWSAIQQIISSLQLNVVLTKVKAHSNDEFNDRADILAKEGQLSDNIIPLNHRLTNLNMNILWDKSLPIDCNIRKSVGKIIDYQTFERHLGHKSMELIKTAHLNKEIDWFWTRLWMKYNPFERPTSLKLTNNFSWKIKNATYNLPTLNILQRNFPNIILNDTNCLLCNSFTETNDHIWTCSVSIKILYDIFSKHQVILTDLHLTPINYQFLSLT